MERFGGFGRHRDLGLLLYQLMSVMDFLQVDNIGAAQDVVSLLVVALDQAVMDGGRFDLAALLTLQEAPPSTIFVNRQQSSLSRARAFTPHLNSSSRVALAETVGCMRRDVDLRTDWSGSPTPLDCPPQSGPGRGARRG